MTEAGTQEIRCRLEVSFFRRLICFNCHGVGHFAMECTSRNYRQSRNFRQKSVSGWHCRDQRIYAINCFNEIRADKSGQNQNSRKQLDRQTDGSYQFKQQSEVQRWPVEELKLLNAELKEKLQAAIKENKSLHSTVEDSRKQLDKTEKQQRRLEVELVQSRKELDRIRNECLREEIDREEFKVGEYKKEHVELPGNKIKSIESVIYSAEEIQQRPRDIDCNVERVDEKENLKNDIKGLAAEKSWLLQEWLKLVVDYKEGNYIMERKNVQELERLLSEVELREDKLLGAKRSRNNARSRTEELMKRFNVLLNYKVQGADEVENLKKEIQTWTVAKLRLLREWMEMTEEHKAENCDIEARNLIELDKLNYEVEAKEDRIRELSNLGPTTESCAANAEMKELKQGATEEETRKFLELLCRILAENKLGNIQVEALQQAKFNQDSAIQPMWILLLNVVSFIDSHYTGKKYQETLSQVIKTKEISYVKDTLRKWKVAVELYQVPPYSFLSGSRELLMAFMIVMVTQQLADTLIAARENPLQKELKTMSESDGDNAPLKRLMDLKGQDNIFAGWMVSIATLYRQERGL